MKAVKDIEHLIGQSSFEISLPTKNARITCCLSLTVSEKHDNSSAREHGPYCMPRGIAI